jgi:hypothetical protein
LRDGAAADVGKRRARGARFAGTVPAQAQHRDVVVLLGPRAEAAHVGVHRSERFRGQRRVGQNGELRDEARRAVELAARVHRFGDAVGDDRQRLASRHLAKRRGILVILHHA